MSKKDFYAVVLSFLVILSIIVYDIGRIVFIYTHRPIDYDKATILMESISVGILMLALLVLTAKYKSRKK